MIEVSLREFLTWFAIGGLLMVIGVWAYFRLMAVRRALRKRRERVTCRLCQLRYFNHGAESVSHCPNCGGRNEKGGQRRL